MNDNLKTFCDFLGMGNPDSKIWFVGLEEGGNEINQSNFRDKLNSCYQYPHYFEIKDGDKKSSVWDYISKILLQYENRSYSNWREMRRIMFVKEHSYFFLTELFPLPKKSYESWTTNYKPFFGFSEYEIDKYKEEVANYRFPKIRELWNSKSPEITICFGESAWNYFETLFHLTNQYNEMSNSFKIYKKQKIILTPFFGNGRFSNRKVVELTEIIRMLYNKQINTDAVM